MKQRYYITTLAKKLIISVQLLLVSSSLLLAQIPLEQVTEAPSAQSGRFNNTTPPEVIMGCAQIPLLAGLDTADWSYVRHHLDGVWLNGASTGVDNVLKMANDIKSKNYYFIGSINTVEYSANGTLTNLEYNINPSFFNGLIDETDKAQVVLVNDYITKEGANPLRYYGDGYMQMAAEYTKKKYGDGKDIFANNCYITVRSGQFLKQVYNKTKNGDLTGRAFSTMQYICKGGGVVWERSPMELPDEPAHQKTYLQAYNRAHELGGEMLWLVPRGNFGTPEDYTTSLVECYEWFEKNQCFPDKIIIIGYSRAAAAGEIAYHDMLPEKNVANPDLPAPGSFTGAMYWCIKQREKHLALGLKDQASEVKEFRAYPNPSTGSFQVENPWMSDAQLNVYNTSGQLILNDKIVGNGQLDLDLGQSSSGVCFLCLSNANGAVISQKMVLNN